MSVDCALKLKSTFFQNDDGWSIEQGSILDTDYVSRLGKFDIVYSWGVLHHTGDMWQSIENATTLVEQDGMLFISIYNDQGGASKRWRMLKKAYNKWRFLRPFLLSITFLRQWHLALIKDFLELKPFRSWKAYKVDRGMSPWIDIIDWAGGYPFEVAKPEQIFNAITKKGFVLTYLKTCGGGIGCNEFAFKKL
jgi:2-polyprenyl-6-hydroxyphenyl methylase/3-demethylubiquinone-9 3-methyltransferase